MKAPAPRGHRRDKADLAVVSVTAVVGSLAPPMVAPWRSSPHVTLADRIVVMRDGDVEQIGTPFELYDRPANEFVGGFIGSPSMNFLACSVKNGSFVTTDGIVLPVGGEPPDGASR